jgi:hypothetical protein
MELIKRKIFLEDNTDRNYGSKTWGTVTATTFYINIFLTQSFDDMGLFTDTEKVKTTVNYTVLNQKLTELGLGNYTPVPFTLAPLKPFDKITLRLPSSNESNYYLFGNQKITGNTDSKIEDVRSYKKTNPFRTGFNVGTDTYENYNNVTINGVDRIKSMGEPKIYVFDTPNDANLGENNQVYGLQYLDYTSTTVPTTIVKYVGEGWNETNTSLSAITKEEYLFGIISPPEVDSDVFIDRGTTSVMDFHLRLSEISNLDELERYGNGFYNLTKD